MSCQLIDAITGFWDRKLIPVIFFWARYRMFEQNMDEYLEEEIDHLKATLEAICAQWDRKVLHSPVSPFPHPP